MLRIGEPPQRERKYAIRHGVYAALPLGGLLLVTLQLDPGGGVGPEFQLPGGGIDPGECPVRALHREVLEETGWRISSPRRIGAFRRFTFMPEYGIWAEKVCSVYVARPTRRISDPTDAGHVEVWLDGETASRKLANQGDRIFAARALDRFRPT